MRIVIVCIAVSVLGWFLLLSTHITFNLSPSLPYVGFFCIKNLPLKRGQLVCLEGHKTLYAGTKHLTKRLLGLEGDAILHRNGALFVGGKKVGPVHPQTLDGRLLTPVNALKVPPGCAFVAGSHDRSFDSRYQEFGLVPLSKIYGRCFGLKRCGA